MAIAKLIPGNDVVEGCAVIGPPKVAGGLSAVIYDNTERTVHVADPTATSFSQMLNGRFSSGPWNSNRPVDVSSTSDTASGTSGGEATITYAASPSQRHALYGVAWSYNGVTNGSGTLKVEAGSGNIVFQATVPANSAGSFPFEQGLRTSTNVDMIVRLRGVTGCVGTVSTMGHRME